MFSRHLFTQVKLWLYRKLTAWYFTQYASEEVWEAENKRFRQLVREKITRDFGQKCKGLNLSCSCCQANLALDIIEDLYYEDRDIPEVYNKSLHREEDEQV